MFVPKSPNDDKSALVQPMAINRQQAITCTIDEQVPWRHMVPQGDNYRQTSDIIRTLIRNKIVDHSDVVLGLITGFNGLGKDNCKTRREIFKFCELVRLILVVWRESCKSNILPW